MATTPSTSPTTQSPGCHCRFPEHDHAARGARSRLGGASQARSPGKHRETVLFKRPEVPHGTVDDEPDDPSCFGGRSQDLAPVPAHRIVADRDSQH